MVTKKLFENSPKFVQHTKCFMADIVKLVNTMLCIDFQTIHFFWWIQYIWKYKR